MTDWAAGLSRTERARLALEISIVAGNAKQLGQQLDRIVAKVPASEPSTILELTAAAHLVQTIQRSLEAKTIALADALDAEALSRMDA